MAYASADLGSGYAIECSWSETSTSVSNNTSNISISGKIWRKTSYNAFSYTGAGSLTVYWHDNKSNQDIAVASMGIDEIGYSVSERSVSGSITVAHHGDGTLSGYAFTHWEKSYNSGYIPPSGNAVTGWVALTTIPRASSIDSFTGTDIEGNFKVTYTAKSSSFTNKLRISIPNVVALQTNNYASGTNFTLSASAKQEIYNRITSGNSITLGAVIETWSGSTKIGESSELMHTCYLHEPEPTFSNFTYRDVNSTTTTITGNNQVMISGKSSLEATITTANKATAKYNATMGKYTFQVAGLTGEAAYSSNSSVVKVIGAPTVAANETPSATRDLVVTAIDSRGLSKAVTKAITIVPYSSPVISATATRTNGFENTTTVNISGTFSRIEVGGTAKNTVNTSNGVQYRYRQQGSSTWGSWTSRTATVDTATGKVTTAAFTLNLDNQHAYEFEFKIIDKLETKTASLTVSVGQPAFYIGTDGRVSVGGMPTQSKKTGEAGLLQVMGRIFADNLYPVGSIYMTTTMTSASQVNAALGGTWEAWGKGRVPVGVDTSETEFNTVEKTGGEKTHTLTVQEMPSHHHSLCRGQYGNQYMEYIAYSSGAATAWRDAAMADTGGGQAHNNLQPYITCYMYKRTA